MVLYPDLCTAAFSLGCLKGGYRVASAVVRLASEWHHVACAVCVACGTQGAHLFMHKVPVSNYPD